MNTKIGGNCRRVKGYWMEKGGNAGWKKGLDPGERKVEQRKIEYRSKKEARGMR